VSALITWVCIIVIFWALFLGGSRWEHALEVIAAMAALVVMYLVGGVR
jgi:hypothetical protein